MYKPRDASVLSKFSYSLDNFLKLFIALTKSGPGVPLKKEVVVEIGYRSIFLINKTICLITSIVPST